MQVESLNLKNFKAFRSAEMKAIPRLCVVVGANGTGKSTVFQVFGFLKDALTHDVHVALQRLGGSRGFHEVRSRGAEGPIEIELKFRTQPDAPLITYQLAINERDGAITVERELLQYRRGRYGKPWRFLDFAHGEGEAVTNEPDKVTDEKLLTREKQRLKSPDTLAIKGLAQFQRFPAAMSLGDLITNWHVSDISIDKTRPEQEAGVAEHLTSRGENLSLVLEYLMKRHPQRFQQILNQLSTRIPGLSKVDAKTTEEGRVLLRFQDGSFSDPFLARYVSDGTIKMLAYLVLLYDPKPHPLLCIEEPENQLYPSLLQDLVEEFRSYAHRGGQVFVSTHSPDFLNGCRLDEVFWIIKEHGASVIHRASDNAQVAEYMKNDDKMGYLWKQGFFDGVDPR